MIAYLKKCFNWMRPKSLNLGISHCFSIKNYMKTFQLQNIQRTQTHQKHQIFRVDQFKNFALQKQNVQQFIQQENSSYQNISKKWETRTKKYYQQISERKDRRTTSSEQQYDQYSYFTEVKFIEDKQYTVIHRRHNKDGKLQVVLDIMQYYPLKKYYKTIELVRTSFSGTHRFVAFGYDLNNNEIIRWMIKDIKHNNILGIKGWQANVLEEVNQIVFYKDQGIFFTKTQNRRPSKLYYQEFNSDPQLLFEQKDPSTWLYLELSKDKSHLMLSCTTKSRIKVKCLKLPEKQFSFTSANIQKLWIEITPARQPQKIQVNHCLDYFVVLRQNQVESTIQIKKDNQNAFKLIHTLDPEQMMIDMDIFSEQVVLYIQKNTKPMMKVIETKNEFKILAPELPYLLGKISPGMNQSYWSQSLLFYISTPFVYNECYSYDFNTKSFTVKEKFQLTGPKFKQQSYEVKTIEVPALDGQKIPLTILAQKLTVQYPKKLIIKVYGFYGLSNEVTYDSMHCPLLENGWTIAYAHVRGGSEKGKQWHHQALKNKALIWSDLEDIVAYLIKEKYTHPSLLFLFSHSAGAITVWNLINKSPHLFKGVVLNYPFLDVLNSLLDPNDPLSASDHAEFGNPLVSKKSFRSIESISPYENIEAKPYPFIYIIGGKNDYRTPVEQLVKFVKRFRQIAWVNNRFSDQISQKGIILKVYDESSHLGSSDIGQENYNNCEIYGFLDYLVYEASHDCKY